MWRKTINIYTYLIFQMQWFNKGWHTSTLNTWNFWKSCSPYLTRTFSAMHPEDENLTRLLVLGTNLVMPLKCSAVIIWRKESLNRRSTWRWTYQRCSFMSSDFWISIESYKTEKEQPDYKKSSKVKKKDLFRILH